MITDQLYKSMVLDTAVKSFFKNKNKYNENPVEVVTEISEKLLRFTFNHISGKQAIDIPLPFTKNGLEFIEHNSILRSVGKYLVVEGSKESLLTYMDIIINMFCSETPITSKYIIKRGPFIKKIYNSFIYKNAPTIAYLVQKTINELINRMPLHETDMNTWGMNRRVTIIDPCFESITVPSEKLKYQVEKSKKYFGRGWTSIGLSDGVLSDDNYILTESLRRTIPFGFYHHNPQRNLYQTLCMLGDEKPLVKNSYMESLENQGISRKGWNLFTIFADIPDVWEDQIMVDKSLCEKFIVRHKKLQCYNKVLVKEGDLLTYGQAIAINKDKQLQRIDLVADKIIVSSVTKESKNIGGVVEEVYSIIVEYTRYIKEGTKITNLAANKGVVKVANLGYAINPTNNQREKIQVIVSCRAVEKRKNYSQILEALFNNLTENKGVVVDDFIKLSQNNIEDMLNSKGFPKDGTWECVTYAGNFRAIAGKVFWGVTKDVENMLWNEKDVNSINNRELRTAGIKFSTVEFRSLKTRFGEDDPITKEILSYAQGAPDLKEMLNILRSSKGIPIPDKILIKHNNVSYVKQKDGILFENEEVADSVVDEFYMSEGFMMTLPEKFQTSIDKSGKILYEGGVLETDAVPNEYERYITDKVYIPHSNLRRCWNHKNGKLGLSELGTVINNLVSCCNNYVLCPEDQAKRLLLYKSISLYFEKVTNVLCTKKGDISIYGMSVRYPYSIKGVATLSNDLPKNTIQIHEEFAKILRVEEGDVVLVERFPCLGFMSLRPQKVTIAKDSMCYYTIRVSGNSLGSLSVDFDGDVLYVASFHTKEAKDILNKEWINPNKRCYAEIKKHNQKMGKPHFSVLNLQDYNIAPFDLLNVDRHAEIVSKITGVKAHTGPVVALAYNIMRIVENSELSNNQKVNVAIEVFLDKVANSVFKQKHGVKSLHEIVTEAVCIGDVKTLVSEGFEESTSITITDLIKRKAKEVGIQDLKWFYDNVTREKGTTIISRIVRFQNRLYFVSRSNINRISTINSLDGKTVDLPSMLFNKIINKPIEFNFRDKEYNDKTLAQLNSDWTRLLYQKYVDVIDPMFFSNVREQA